MAYSRVVQPGKGWAIVPPSLDNQTSKKLKESLMTDAAYAWGFANSKARNAQQAINSVHEANNTIDLLNDRVLAAEAEVQRLRDLHAVARCEIAGLVAQRNAFKTQHPTSPLLADSGKVYAQDGKAKSVVRLIFERAFDARAVELKIANPVGRRAN